MERNRLGSASDRTVRRSLEAHLTWLQGQIDGTEEELDAAIEAKRGVEGEGRATAVDQGISPGVARTRLFELPELGRLSREQIGALAGLAR
jgi:transposase